MVQLAIDDSESMNSEFYCCIVVETKMAGYFGFGQIDNYYMFIVCYYYVTLIQIVWQLIIFF